MNHENRNAVQPTSAIELAGRQSGSIMLTQETEAPSTRFSATNQPAVFQTRKRHGGTLRVTCPHCSAIAKARSSKQLTPLFKELRYQCLDLECGHTFVASLNIERSIVPSSKPNPRIRLKVGLPVATTPANDAGVL